MRTTFKNSELVHIFSTQSQPYGKTPNNSIFFEDNKIYSYGRHFCMAHILENIPNTVLFNSNSYSITTSQHQGQVHYALNHFKNFSVPWPECPTNRENLNYCVTEFDKALDKQSRARKYSYVSELNGFKDTLEFLITQLVGKDNKHCRKSFTAKLKNMKVTLETLETNPEKVLEIIKDKNRKEQLKIKKEKAKSIKDWKKGLIHRLSHLINEPYLRIRNDLTMVETSKGASVTIQEAKTLWSLIKAKKDIKGYQVGSYTVISINGSLKIGCHNFQIKEVERFGKILDAMKLED